MDKFKPLEPVIIRNWRLTINSIKTVQVIHATKSPSSGVGQKHSESNGCPSEGGMVNGSKGTCKFYVYQLPICAIKRVMKTFNLPDLEGNQACYEVISRDCQRMYILPLHFRYANPKFTTPTQDDVPQFLKKYQYSPEGKIIESKNEYGLPCSPPKSSLIDFEFAHKKMITFQEAEYKHKQKSSS